MNDARAVPWVANPSARAWTCAPLAAGARAFHASLSDYAPTPLAEPPGLAAELGVGRVFVKDESARLGLPSFKALGASWAIRRALDERAARGQTAPTALVAATDGNQGRAVARFAARSGHAAIVVVAPGIHPGAVAAIRSEGAEVVDGSTSYDDAVARATSMAAQHDGMLIQDTSWPGYEQVPNWIVEGYATLCAEVDEQLDAAGAGAPDLVVVPVGVGSLAQAVVAHYRSTPAAGRPAILAVEPVSAACVLASLRTGQQITIETQDTIMAGLNCGTPSSLAWPYLRDGLDAAVAIDDETCLTAMRDLTRLGLAVGPCGAAALGALRLSRGKIDLRSDAVVILLSTEGSAANPHASDGV